jgi:hypothetical protein
VLDVMAWGTGPVDPESAWAAYRQLEKQLVLSNVGSKAYYGAEVAAVLARSQAVPRDSVHAVLARVRGDALTAAEGYPPVREELLGLEAAVLYRLGDSSRADELVAQFQRRDPARANRWAGRRMLRDFVTASGPAGR